MNLYWDSFADFVAMGGYGPFVWACYGVTALVVVLELWSLRSRRKALTSETEE